MSTVSAVETLSRYVVSDATIGQGEPRIAGTRITVRAIVELWRLGVRPEEIPLHLPHITLAQVFAALSYYADHQAVINDYIRRNQVPDELVDPVVRAAFPET